MLEGIYGGYFCRKRSVRAHIECVHILLLEVAALTYPILDARLTEQQLRHISQRESYKRCCQNHRGQVVVHSSHSLPYQPTAHLIQMH